jgi:hypothetical protein
VPYTNTTFGSMVTALSVRLNDPTFQFWSQAELEQRIQDALRLWNILTAQNTQWYPLAISSTNPTGPWYDLQAISGSPRLCTLEDTDVYSRIQYHLLEEQLSNAGVLTSQFSTPAMVSSVQGKRDEFLFRTSCTRTVETLVVTPSNALLPLPQSVIQVERAYWLPLFPGTPYPLYRTDQFSRAGFYPLLSQTQADPLVQATGVEPPLTMELTPTPGNPGSVEAVCIESQAALVSTVPTVLYIPGDFVPGLAWGAVSDMLDFNMEGQDQDRADYARQRFEQYCELLSIYPFIMGAKVASTDTQTESVEALDAYMPGWRSPVENIPIVAFAGQNLVCFPSTTNQQIVLLINASAALPTLLTDPVQVGFEIVDAILDCAQHEAMFKQGMYEIETSKGMFQNFLQMAAKRNSKLAALATFKDYLYTGQNTEEKLFAPAEVES